jgi:hypothetical protein
MLRIGNISEVMQTRTLRVNYGNTQAYPFAANLDANVYNAVGVQGALFTAGGGTAIGTGGQGPIWPGQVAALAQNGLTVCVAVGATSGLGTAGQPPLGLFGNFVGGDFDEINYGGGYTEIGVWKGPGSWYEVLSPVFNSNIVASQTVGASAYGTARNLYWDGNGLLSNANPGAGGGNTSLFSPVAILGSYTPAKIAIELLI